MKQLKYYQYMSIIYLKGIKQIFYTILIKTFDYFVIHILIETTNFHQMLLNREKIIRFFFFQKMCFVFC